MSDEFDGRVLNPNGVEIDLPFWLFKRLKKLHLLERERDRNAENQETRRIGSAGCLMFRVPPGKALHQTSEKVLPELGL